MIPSLARRWRVMIAATVVVSTLLPAATSAAAAPGELFFSEVIEGSSNNKALEIYNGTGASLDLATNGYNVQVFFNGSTSPGLTINLVGIVADGDVFVVAQSLAVAAILAQADQTNGAGWFNGDDAVVLRRGTVIVDSLGQVGFDPGSEWGTGLASTADNTLRRKAVIGVGDANPTDPFDPGIEWDGYATDTFDGLGGHTYGPPVEDAAPTVAATIPVSGATLPFDASLSVTFSEPVNVDGTALTLACTTSGDVALAVSGGPTTFTLDPAIDLAHGEACTLTVLAAGVSDQDADDPPDGMVADVVVSFTAEDVCQQEFTPTPAIQGTGLAAAITGPVTTMGVVVGDYERPSGSSQLRGFYLQDAAGDADPVTSDGIFVFNGNLDSVSIGDLVRVTGTAGEFQDQTQVSASAIVRCGTGSIAATDVTLPFQAASVPERYEGMLVRLPQTLVVTEHFQLGRFGQVVMSSGARLRVPTAVVPPGAPAIALQATNNLNRIIVDDGNNLQNVDPIEFGRGGQPLSASNTLRGGDTATGTVGVMTYGWAGSAASGNAFRVRPIGALDGHVMFDAANQRPTARDDVGGSIRVAGLNLLNYYNTFDGIPDTVDNCRQGVGGIPADCRGADTPVEFARQWPKTVAAILALDADVVGVNELENDGYAPDSAIADLVNRLNAATAPGTYAFVDADAATGRLNALGVDAIKVGMLYRPGVVTPVGRTAVLDSLAFVNGGDGVLRSRPSLAQAFEVNASGARLIVDTNHLKSKGSPCDAPDAGDGQGNCNIVRTSAANALVAWLATDPTGTGDPDVLLLGDYNSYAKEDPIVAIEAGGYQNLVAARIGEEAYSFVFDGQWGYLDYAFASESLRAQVTGIAERHINADEPSVLDYNTDFKTPNLVATLYASDEFRVSDHDPVVVGLELTAGPRSDRPATGTGWITSPAGAYVPLPGATGKSQFAFDAKYVKGSTVVQGFASFSLPAAGLVFESASLQWLITDAPRATIEGLGALNGVAGHRFRITARDGSPDLLRFQAWAPDGTVVYDNGALAAIGGGSITVRPPR